MGNIKYPPVGNEVHPISLQFWWRPSE